MTYRILGLDWFDVVVQFALTVAAGVAVDNMLQGTPVHDPGMAALIAGSIALLGFRRSRARAGAGPASSEDTDRLADVEARVAELEAERGRIYELEERLDFAERMLAQQRDQVRLPGGRG